MYNIRIMSIGSNCVDIFTIPDDMRIKGPVDNILSERGFVTVENILKRNLENIFFEKGLISEPYRYSRTLNAYRFNDYTFVHNNPLDKCVQDELRKRINNLYNFIDNLGDNDFLVYCLGAYDINDKGELSENFKKGYNLIKEYNLENKVIILGITSSDLDWFTYNVKELDNYPNTIRMDLPIRDKLKSRDIFRNVLYEFLNNLKKEQPMLSIVVPVYNVVNYLNKSLFSIQNQTYSNFECILVDDGSTDGSADICKQFAANDKRFKYIYKENGGVSSARNLGIDNISKESEYIAFFDPDDFIEFNYYESIINAMKEYDCEVGCGRRLLLKDFNPIPKLERSINKYSYHHGPSFFLWQHVFKTSVILKNNIRFLPICHYEDGIFVADVYGFAKNNIVGYEEYSYYIYTDKRQGSICHTNYEKNKQRTIEALPVQIKHLEELRQNPNFKSYGISIEEKYIDDTKRILKERFND